MDAVVRVELTRGYSAVVDTSDLALVGAYTWRAVVGLCAVYAATTVRGKTTYMHRLLLDAPAGMDVDHIDHDGLNNSRANLRLCTHAENMRNRKKNRNAAYKGVWAVPHGRWMAVFHRRSIGTFLTAEDAARAWDAVAVREQGEFASLNFPQEAT